MNLAAFSSDVAASVARLRLLARALGYFRADAGRVGLAMGLLLASIGINLLKPWPLAILVDSVLGTKPYPSWLPSQMPEWTQPGQLIAIIAASLALHLAHSAVCARGRYVAGTRRKRRRQTRSGPKAMRPTDALAGSLTSRSIRS